MDYLSEEQTIQTDRAAPHFFARYVFEESKHRKEMR